MLWVAHLVCGSVKTRTPVSPTHLQLVSNRQRRTCVLWAKRATPLPSFLSPSLSGLLQNYISVQNLFCSNRLFLEPSLGANLLHGRRGDPAGPRQPSPLPSPGAARSEVQTGVSRAPPLSQGALGRGASPAAPGLTGQRRGAMISVLLQQGKCALPD